MTDAYDTLREMLANVPDDAQVYVEELESIVEWPGITAGTFRQLLAEIAGTCACTSGIHDGLCMKGCRTGGTE